jgi:hypothetical protein
VGLVVRVLDLIHLTIEVVAVAALEVYCKRHLLLLLQVLL